MTKYILVFNGYSVQPSERWDLSSHSIDCKWRKIASLPLWLGNLRPHFQQTWFTQSGLLAWLAFWGTVSIQDLIPFHSLSPLKQSQKSRIPAGNTKVYHDLLRLIHGVTYLSHSKTCLLNPGRGLSGMIRWAGGIQCHSTFGDVAKDMLKERCFGILRSENERRKWAIYQFYFQQGLHFWWLNFGFPWRKHFTRCWR